MKRLWINLGISVIIGALFVWLAIRGVDWTEVGQVLTSVDPWILANYFLLLMVVQLLRTVRWGILLKPLGEVSFARLFSVSAVGIMALILLPLRLGEFARPVLIAEKGKIRGSAALATVVVERVVDSLAMAALLVMILFFLQGRVRVPGEIQFWAIVSLGLFLLILLFLVLTYRHEERAVWLFGKLLSPLPQRIGARLINMLRSFIHGLQALPNARLLSGFLLLTIVYWALAGIGMQYMFSAFPDLAHLGAEEAFTVLAVLCVGLIIPAGPGMIGNFHYFAKVGLSLFVGGEVLDSAGVAYVILVHAMQLGQQLLVGLPFLFSNHISLGRMLSWPIRVESGLEEGEK